MKLQIKHIAPYLPYKLKAKMMDYKSDYVNNEYDTLVGLHQWDSRELYWSVLTIGGSKPEINSIKPILRPFTDLHPDFEIEDINPFMNLSLRSRQDLEDKDSENLVMKYSYEDLQVLFKYHYDVFGLIGQGLAIDINTIKND